MKFSLIDDKTGYSIAEFRVESMNEVAISGSVYNPYSWEYEGSPLEYNYFAGVHIKWDACSHFYYRGEEYGTKDWEQDGCYHICGGHSYLDHIRTIAFVLEVGRMNIKRYDVDEFDKLDSLNILKGFTIVKED